MHNVLITGANGFIGNELVEFLSKKEYNIIAACRTLNKNLSSTVTHFRVDNLPTEDWSDALEQVDCIIHLAGRAHILKETVANPLDEFYEINTLATLNLAQQAAKSNVKRLIFISSIGVNGNQTTQPFKEQDTPRPISPYAISKYQAEQGLSKIAKETGLEIVIIRPPLVYGKNAPGNFKRLIDLIYKGFPLPLGAINNKRSLISIGNLIDFIEVCISHKNATNKTFLLSDGNDMSTTALVRNIAKALDRSIILIPIPVYALEFVATMVGKQSTIQQLCSSLQIDMSHAKKTLDWEPPLTFDSVLQEMTSTYLEAKESLVFPPCKTKS